MNNKTVTIREATEKWVNTFNALPTDMIKTLVNVSIDGCGSYDDYWENAAPPLEGERVFVFGKDGVGICAITNGTVVKYDETSGLYTIELDSGNPKTVEVEESDFSFDNESELVPMWGTMWQFGDSADTYWLTDMGGLREMVKCGFTVIHSDEFGYFFGIDGGGYDFYEHHWIPLYKARGLQWHIDKNEDEVNS